MHTIRLNIDDSIFDKFMGLLDILPRNKVEVTEESEYPSVLFDEAKAKVEKAVNNISSNSGISVDDTISKVLKSEPLANFQIQLQI